MACDDPGRITGGGPGADLTAPSVQFVSPSRDTTYTSVSEVVVYVRVSDPSGVASITATASGGLSFTWGTFATPPSTEMNVSFQLPTLERTADSIHLTVSASDVRLNRSPDRVLNVVVH